MHGFGVAGGPRDAGIVVAQALWMPVFAYSDETIRIPRQVVRPSRPLPEQFAPVRRRRWPWLVVAALAGFAFADPIDVTDLAERTVQAQELLRLLSR